MIDFVLSTEVLARKRLATRNGTKARRLKILVTNINTYEIQKFN